MANTCEVESMEIPACDEDLYNEACRADGVVAQSLSIPTDRRYATMVLEGLGSEVIGKVEKLSANVRYRKEHGFEYKGIKPAIQVFFPGETTVGRPYMAIIPFYISGKVTVGSKPVELKRHYHVSGECPLLVEREEGKLGAWVFKLGK
ncbi:hypothetical protein N7475_003520 [Penicillium sp. IBT 31633x]|nr:hypothetical protein N7475_003520 [Penicillium sp. IBT 31633x]